MTSPERWQLAAGPLLPAVADPRIRRARRILIHLGTIGLMLGVLVVFHPVYLAGFARAFRVDEPVASDAIVLLLGGCDHRAPRAAELYRRRLAPRIVMVSAPETSAPALSEPLLCRDELIREGVPPQAIEILHGVGTSTFSEAGLIRDHARQQNLHSLLLVTTAFHTARARWVFRKVFRGTGVEIHVAAAEHPGFGEQDWYLYDDGWLTYGTEALKTIYYRIRY